MGERRREREALTRLRVEGPMWWQEFGGLIDRDFVTAAESVSRLIRDGRVRERGDGRVEIVEVSGG